MSDIPRYDLPDGTWAEYRKVATTRMIAVTGPAVVETKEGEYPLPDGWRGFIALDADVHTRSYEPA